MQVHAWSFDVHGWAQQEPDFFCLLIMEILRQEGLLVRRCPPAHNPASGGTYPALHHDWIPPSLLTAAPAFFWASYGHPPCHFMQNWKIPEVILERFLRRVCDEYIHNPYHNAAHAADVTQAMAIMINMGLSDRLTRLEKLSLVLAAAVHDLGHPGVNNQFLVETRNHWALVYNDISVNENMHVSRAFILAEEEGLFATLKPAEYNEASSSCPLFVFVHALVRHYLLVCQSCSVEPTPHCARWQREVPFPAVDALCRSDVRWCLSCSPPTCASTFRYSQSGGLR